MMTRLLLVLSICLALSGCLSPKRVVKVVQCKPSELQVSETLVFSQCKITHEQLSECRVFLYIGDEVVGNWFTFLPDQRFEGSQIRSAFPAAYHFNGKWSLTGDGFLRLDGGFNDFNKAYESHLPAEQPFSLVVSKVAYVPARKRLKLFVKKQKKSNKTSGGDIQ